MIKINVLKSEEREKRKDKTPTITAPKSEREATNLFGGILIGVVLLCAILWWFQHGKISKLQNNISSLKNEEKKLSFVEEQLKELDRKNEIIKAKIRIIERLKEFRTLPVKVMDKLSKSIPEELWFDSLEYSGGNINIKGRAFANEWIVKLIENLRDTNNFSGFNLRQTKKIKAGGYELFDFNLSFRYVGK